MNVNMNTNNNNTNNKEPSFSTLIYSKYSKNSTKFLELIKNSGVDFTSFMKMECLCVDNEKIRKRILSNTKIEVKTVPCVLVVFPSGSIEKYDGEAVFSWANNIINSHKQVLDKNQKEKEKYEKSIREQAIEEAKAILKKEQEIKANQEQLNNKPVRKSSKKQKTSISFDSDEDSSLGNNSFGNLGSIDEENEPFDTFNSDLEKNRKQYEEIQKNKDTLNSPSGINTPIGNMNGSMGKPNFHDLSRNDEKKKLNKAEMLKHSLLEKAKEMERERKI
jgi:hypothetical protein